MARFIISAAENAELKTAGNAFVAARRAGDQAAMRSMILEVATRWIALEDEMAAETNEACRSECLRDITMLNRQVQLMDSRFDLVAAAREFLGRPFAAPTH